MKGKTKKLIKLATRGNVTLDLFGQGSTKRREVIKNTYIGREALEELQRRAAQGDSAAVQFIKSRTN